MAQQALDFGAPYLFKMNNLVVIEHAHRANLRITPQNEHLIDGHGGQGPFARWKVHLEPHGRVKLQNDRSGKFLRIKSDQEMDCNGGGGKWCVFRVETIGQPNQVKLESVQCPGLFLAFKPTREAKIGKGGKMCNLTFYRQGQMQRPQQPRPQPIRDPIRPHPVVQQQGGGGGGGGQFASPYHFKMNQRVVVDGPHGKTLRVHPQNTTLADGAGGRGGFAHWDAILHANGLVQLKSVKTGGFLRIFENGSKIDVQGGPNGRLTFFKYHKQGQPNTVTLESNHFPNKWIGIRPNHSMAVGNGGPNCKLTFFRQGGRAAPQVQQPPRPQVQPQPQGGGGGGGFGLPYHFRRNNTVVVRTPHGKHLRVSPQNGTLADGVGGQGGFAQWEAILHNNKLVQLKSLRTGKFLRIFENGSKVDVQGGANGRLTFFKYHGQGQANVVKLESNHFPNRWIAVRPNHTVVVGNGGPNCPLTFFRRQ